MSIKFFFQHLFNLVLGKVKKLRVLAIMIPEELQKFWRRGVRGPPLEIGLTLLTFHDQVLCCVTLCYSGWLWMNLYNHLLHCMYVWLCKTYLDIAHYAWLFRWVSISKVQDSQTDSQTHRHLALFRPLYLLELCRVLYSLVWSHRERGKIGEEGKMEIGKIWETWGNGGDWENKIFWTKREN